MTSIGHQFYRKRRGFATVALVALIAAIAPAQSNHKKNETGPRALAVVELPAGGKATPRLTPVAILVDGRFWDASIYLADPRPMALDPGNVYEVERSGKPLGFFTISEALHAQDRWTALGEWQLAVEKPAVKMAKSTKPSVSVDEGRPVLHRRQPSSSEQQTSTTAGSSTPTATNSAPTPAPEQPAASDDPNRPVLRRGKPKPQPQVEEPPQEPVQTAGPAKAALPAAPAKPGELLAAISDAGGPEPHSYSYIWASGEEPKLTKAISDIATAEVERYAKSLPALRYTPAARLDQVSVHGFDLDNSNNAVVVYSARCAAVAPAAARGHAAKPAPPSPDFFFYVTVVGQTDLYGELRKLFASVTDSSHLDVFPRLELIDAVDAEGNGRGNLLFRALSGNTTNYELYHVGPDSLRKLFDSAGED